MERVCVFCGKKPQDKNKEHIIPKWLMKLTNTENKKMSVGTNWKLRKEIVFDFSSFAFPACTKCNDEFGKVEVLVKPTIEKILKDDHVETPELLRLLNWFDKVRIGLWLAIQFHNNGTFNMEPKYFINTRLGLKDRLLAITNCYDNYIGLRWTGANTLCFIVSPTCITMKINNVLFTNCSMDYIISEQLGFPYPLFERPNNDPKLTDFVLIGGKFETKNKLFKSSLYAPTTIISQPIFTLSKQLNPQKYDNQYVKDNCYDYENGVGKIFITHDNITYPIELDEEISFSVNPKVKRQYKLNRPTLEFQIELLQSRKQDFSLLDEKDRKDQIASLKMIVDYTKEQMRQYDY